MKKIGNNEFFETVRGAKTAGTKRGYGDGALIKMSREGYCLLDLCEGADDKTRGILISASVVSRIQNGKWRDEKGDFPVYN